MVAQIILSPYREPTAFDEATDPHLFVSDCNVTTKVVCREETFLALMALVVALPKMNFLLTNAKWFNLIDNKLTQKIPHDSRAVALK